MYKYTNPTVEQRLEIYQCALNQIVKDSKMERTYMHYTGLCSYVCDALGKLEYIKEGWSPYYEGMEWHYPELHAQKPKNPYSDYWFPLGAGGMKKRIEVLKNAISECTLLIKTR